MENLALKYRPAEMEEVIGQEYNKIILSSQLENDEIQQAYLFTGASGTGKTTIARIFAEEVNEGNGKPIEIDAASNNGVDAIRNISEEASYNPIGSRYKVFIIDEAHMITTQGFNAFLKTLEEPPENVIFILCTTDPQRLPETVLSRLQRFDFERLKVDEITDRLIGIIDCENSQYEEDYYSVESDETINYIAKLSNGSMRKAIGLLEKCMNYSDELSQQNVEEALGLPGTLEFISITDSIVDMHPVTCLVKIQNIHDSGRDLRLAMRHYSDFILDLCKLSISMEYEDTQLPSAYEEEIEQLMGKVGDEFLLWLLEELNSMNNLVKWETNSKALIETTMLLLTRQKED